MTQGGGITFDATINIGNILTIVLGLIAFTVAWVKLGGRMDMLEYRVEGVEDTLKLVAAALNKFAGNEADIKLLRVELAAAQKAHATLFETVENLRKGKGWIIDDGRPGINGEYSSRMAHPNGSR